MRSATRRSSLENTGTAAWRSRGPVEGVKLAYHWLDELDNPIVWDGIRTAFPRPDRAGRDRPRRLSAARVPTPPGRYRLALDLVDEGRCWFAELGSAAPRARHGRALADRAPRARRPGRRPPVPLDVQEEPVVAQDDAAAVAHLAPGVVPAPDWSRRILDAHEEGWAAVGGSVDAPTGLRRRQAQALAAWVPGGGRVPGFPHPLLCPSLVREAEPAARLGEVEGLPALPAVGDEPALYDARIRVAGRRRERWDEPRRRLAQPVSDQHQHDLVDRQVDALVLAVVEERRDDEHVEDGQREEEHGQRARRTVLAPPGAHELAAGRARRRRRFYHTGSSQPDPLQAGEPQVDDEVEQPVPSPRTRVALRVRPYELSVAGTDSLPAAIRHALQVSERARLDVPATESLR